ncbi:MAG: SDR family oxidoreductase [Xanthomonadales bacterium]|nr:SDR family oxidoreductase [Gammaproteobacteria bacterium]MBT8053743.1 SDR family oxidoreductase [Gammaproteobacteria bacterium]NND57646.1 SDR family oxidoreductase [Xanthomonadales bacterium]NNK51580.1 SDR family oxidoreductase [Xanthomonadales bacterium]
MAAATLPETCLVVGANRGIGLALTTALLEDGDVKRVIATHRPGGDLVHLDELATHYGVKLIPQVLNFEQNDGLENFTKFLSNLEKPVDLAIHAAGILHEDGIEPEKSFSQCKTENLRRIFEVNSIGPLMVAQALLKAQPRKHPFTFAALSAMVGSIGDNRLGGWYGYRASKSALNQFIKTLSIECRNRYPYASIVAIHPGTTDTDLSRPFQRGVKPGKLYTPDQTAARILSVVRSVDQNQSGQFFNWDASQIPW